MVPFVLVIHTYTELGTDGEEPNASGNAMWRIPEKMGRVKFGQIYHQSSRSIATLFSQLREGRLNLW